jgi:hypothetical protein
MKKYIVVYFNGLYNNTIMILGSSKYEAKINFSKLQKSSKWRKDNLHGKSKLISIEELI